MPTDKDNATLLYTMIKYSDLKSVDWEAVATQLGITNGHAARMRYSRFQKSMGSMTATARKPKAIASKKRKEIDDKSEKTKKSKRDNDPQALGEIAEKSSTPTDLEPKAPSATTKSVIQPKVLIEPKEGIEQQPYVKQEPVDTGLGSFLGAVDNTSNSA